MKKIHALTFVIAAALVIGLGHGTAHAQVASSTPLSGVGGYSTPCFYLRQTFEWQPGYVCNDAEHSVQDFALNPVVRESILGDWRQHIFVDVPAKYGWTRESRSY